MLELEAELENAIRRERDLANENRKLQRLLAEHKSQSEEEQRLAAQSAEQNQVLQQRVRTLKRQLEEAVSQYNMQRTSSKAVFRSNGKLCFMPKIDLQ